MYRHVLVPLDGSELAEQVLPHVRQLADAGLIKRITLLRAISTDFPIVIEPGLPAEPLNRIMENHVQEAREYLERIAGELRSAGYAVDTQTETHVAADAIIDYACNSDVDLIAMASHGRSGIGRWLLGSVAQRVAQGTHLPLLLIRSSAK